MMSSTIASAIHSADAACQNPAAEFTELLRFLDAAEHTGSEAVVLAMIDLLFDVFD
jgi:hypothetical protein